MAKLLLCFYNGRQDAKRRRTPPLEPARKLMSAMPQMPQTTPAPRRAFGTGFIDWIEDAPRAAFAAFLALHFVVWIALPALLYANLPLDLIEALTYGREWQLGYDKLPPLPWWLVEIMHRAFGADAAYYALAQAAVVIAFIAVWATARPLIGATGALVAVLIIDGMHYFQYTAVKFNHDVIQLPFWALAGYAFHAALKRGRLAPLAAARLRLRQRAVGEIFRRRLGGALRAVPRFRSRRAPRFGDARAMARTDRRAGHCRAPCRLAVPDRFSAAGLCRAPRLGCARLVRPYPASGSVRRQPDFLPAAVVFHCRAAAVAGSPPPCGEGLGVGVGRRSRKRRRARVTSRPPTLPSPDKHALGRARARPGWGEGICCRRLRSPHRDLARLRPRPRHDRADCRRAAAAHLPCGAIRCGFLSGFGSC